MCAMNALFWLLCLLLLDMVHRPHSCIELVVASSLWKLAWSLPVSLVRDQFGMFVGVTSVLPWVFKKSLIVDLTAVFFYIKNDNFKTFTCHHQTEIPSILTILFLYLYHSHFLNMAFKSNTGKTKLVSKEICINYLENNHTCTSFFLQQYRNKNSCAFKHFKITADYLFQIYFSTSHLGETLL